MCLISSCSLLMTTIWKMENSCSNKILLLCDLTKLVFYKNDGSVPLHSIHKLTFKKQPKVLYIFYRWYKGSLHEKGESMQILFSLQLKSIKIVIWFFFSLEGIRGRKFKNFCRLVILQNHATGGVVTKELTNHSMWRIARTKTLPALGCL